MDCCGHIHTQAHQDGEIRGQLAESGQKNTTSAVQNNSDTETDTNNNNQAESAIVTPTIQ